MYAALKFQDAADRFETLGNDRSALAPAALVNASLASLRAEDKIKSERDKAELVRRGQLDEAAEVALEQAVISAERGEKNAGALLQDFVRRFPDHPRVSEAQMALAEMAYHSSPPKLDEAEKNLAAARATHPTELAVEHADYLAIWLADARGADSDRVIVSARDFIRAHPNSPLVAEGTFETCRIAFSPAGFRQRANRIRDPGTGEPEIGTDRASTLPGRAISDGKHGQPIAGPRLGIADAGCGNERRISMGCAQ